MNNENEDKRGYDLRASHFRTRLEVLINNSNLFPSTIYFILDGITKEIKEIYSNAVDIQYQEFCKEEMAEENLNKNSEDETKENEDNFNKNLNEEK